VAAERLLVGWAVPADALAGSVAPGPADARRLAGLGPERRRAFLSGRALLAGLIEELFPGSAAPMLDTAPCAACGGDHGPVAVRGVPALVSLSHADGLVVGAVAATARATRLGVDVEAARPDPVRDADLGRLLGVPAAGALRRWTEVEAVLKAGGHGLRVDPGLLRFGAGTARVEGVARTYRLAAVEGPAGYLVSLAWSAAGGR
jgi:4'-phosphopantetheinyl transferase